MTIWDVKYPQEMKVDSQRHEYRGLVFLAGPAMALRGS
jgi:hypothetical protein